MARVRGLPPTATAPSVARERIYEATRDGARVLLVKNTPGPLTDTTAGVPPPGYTPPNHRFLSARCMYDAMLCSRVGEILRASSSIDDFFARLRQEGLVVREVDSGQW